MSILIPNSNNVPYLHCIPTSFNSKLSTLEILEASCLGQRSRHEGLVTPWSVSGQLLPKVASAGPKAPKKTINLKDTLACPPEEGQEYYRLNYVFHF